MARRVEFCIDDPVVTEGVLRALVRRSGFTLEEGRAPEMEWDRPSDRDGTLVSARVFSVSGADGVRAEFRVEQRVSCSYFGEERSRCRRLVLVPHGPLSAPLVACVRELIAVAGVVRRLEAPPLGAGMDAGRFTGRMVARAASELLSLLPRIERDADATAILDGWDTADRLRQTGLLSETVHPTLSRLSEVLDPLVAVLDRLRLLGLVMERLARWRSDLPDHDEGERDAVGSRIRIHYERVLGHLYALLGGAPGQEIGEVLRDIAGGTLDQERGRRLGPFASWSLRRHVDAYRAAIAQPHADLEQALRAAQGILCVVSVLGPGLPGIAAGLQRAAGAVRDRIRRVHDSARAVQQLRGMAHGGDIDHGAGVFLLGVLAERHASRGRAALVGLGRTLPRLIDRFDAAQWWIDDPPGEGSSDRHHLQSVASPSFSSTR